MRVALVVALVVACGDNLVGAHDSPDRCCALLPDAGAVRACVADENMIDCAPVVGCDLPHSGIFVVLSNCSDAGP